MGHQQSVFSLQIKKFLSNLLLVTFALLPVFGSFLWIPAFAGMTVEAVGEQPAKPSDFSTAYDVTYDVGNDGVTTVTEKITLTNKTSQYYATDFSLTIGATQLSDISASDPSGPLAVQQQQKGTSTTLAVKFNQQVTGVGKQLPWNLTFKSKDFANQQGKVWEVTLPKIVSSVDLTDYNVTLAIPASFGQLTSISPTPKKSTPNFDKLFLNFDKSQLTTSGVSADFGDKQLFDFNLSYHLENPNIAPILTNIALPPDTEYQDVTFSQIDPKPINVTVDSDGNYLAWYRLNRSQRLDVKVVGSARLNIKSKVKNPVLDPILRQKYLQSQKYWETNNQVIKTKLTEILGVNPSLDSEQKVKLIYQYVVNNLKYDSSRLSGNNIDRLGAVTALSNPSSAVCMEFTDLFITLSRAAGIPTREMDGFAYTNNSTLRPLSLSHDVLHAWPEYWSETKGWVMVDPTWENTTGGVDYFNKLDLNHFVFVTKGLSSEQPVPAGSYKYSGQDSKDVAVNFANEDFLGKSQIDVGVDVSSPIIAGFPGKVKVRVSNLGNSLQTSTDLGISAGKIIILDPKNGTTGPIPAFGYGEFDYNIRTHSLLDSFDDVITVIVGGQKFEKVVSVRPFIIFQSFPFVLIILIAGMILIYFAILGGLIYRRRIKRSHQSSAVSHSPSGEAGHKKSKKKSVAKG